MDLPKESICTMISTIKEEVAVSHDLVDAESIKAVTEHISTNQKHKRKHRRKPKHAIDKNKQ